MKALSVKQPWANAIASGEKTIETRKWFADYRGPLLIVSSKQPRIQPAGCAIGRDSPGEEKGEGGEVANTTTKRIARRRTAQTWRGGTDA